MKRWVHRLLPLVLFTAGALPAWGNEVERFEQTAERVDEPRVLRAAERRHAHAARRRGHDAQAARRGHDPEG